MKNIYTLTCHDCKLNYFIMTERFSNAKVAIASFDVLKKHIIEKFGLDETKVVKWEFNTGGANKTDILSERFNITLVKQSVLNEVLIFPEWIDDVPSVLK